MTDALINFAIASIALMLGAVAGRASTHSLIERDLRQRTADTLAERGLTDLVDILDRAAIPLIITSSTVESSAIFGPSSGGAITIHNVLEGRAPDAITGFTPTNLTRAHADWPAAREILEERTLDRLVSDWRDTHLEERTAS